MGLIQFRFLFPAINETQRRSRKQKNIVSTGVNCAAWELQVSYYKKPEKKSIQVVLASEASTLVREESKPSAVARISKGLGAEL